jgi:hypothetical protein
MPQKRHIVDVEGVVAQRAIDDDREAAVHRSGCSQFDQKPGLFSRAPEFRLEGVVVQHQHLAPQMQLSNQVRFAGAHHACEKHNPRLFWLWLLLWVRGIVLGCDMAL